MKGCLYRIVMAVAMLMYAAGNAGQVAALLIPASEDLVIVDKETSDAQTPQFREHEGSKGDFVLEKNQIV